MGVMDYPHILLVWPCRGAALPPSATAPENLRLTQCIWYLNIDYWQDTSTLPLDNGKPTPVQLPLSGFSKSLHYNPSKFVWHLTSKALRLRELMYCNYSKPTLYSPYYTELIILRYLHGACYIKLTIWFHHAYCVPVTLNCMLYTACSILPKL